MYLYFQLGSDCPKTVTTATWRPIDDQGRTRGAYSCPWEGCGIYVQYTTIGQTTHWTPQGYAMDKDRTRVRRVGSPWHM